MKKKEIGELLYRFYRKRTASFLANLYKASITGDSEDIHRLRVDVKKINAYYSLFEMIQPDLFKRQAQFNLFINLFKISGRIREIQVHLIFLSKSDFEKTDFASFIIFLKEQETRATRNFLMAIKDFNDKELKSTEKKIKKICLDIPAKKLSIKSEEFIRKKAKKIQFLQNEDQGIENVHKIRKHLKAMSTISTLIFTLNPNENLKLIIDGLNKAEVMIGKWHDNIVLNKTIDLYLKNRKGSRKVNPVPLKKLRRTLLTDNHSLLKQLMPEVSNVIQLILPAPEPETGLQDLQDSQDQKHPDILTS